MKLLEEKNNMVPYALIKKGTEHNPEFLIDYAHINSVLTPQFGIMCGDTLKLIVFFDYEAAHYEVDNILMMHKIHTEILNLITMETVK
jgi:hypothetical protein